MAAHASSSDASIIDQRGEKNEPIQRFMVWPKVTQVKIRRPGEPEGEQFTLRFGPEVSKVASIATKLKAIDAASVKELPKVKEVHAREVDDSGDSEDGSVERRFKDSSTPGNLQLQMSQGVQQYTQMTKKNPQDGKEHVVCWLVAMRQSDVKGLQQEFKNIIDEIAVGRELNIQPGKSSQTKGKEVARRHKTVSDLDSKQRRSGLAKPIALGEVSTDVSGEVVKRLQDDPWSRIMYSTPKTKPPHFDDKHYTCPDKENCGKNSVVWVIGEVGLNKKANIWDRSKDEWKWNLEANKNRAQMDYASDKHGSAVFAAAVSKEFGTAPQAKGVIVALRFAREEEFLACWRTALTAMEPSFGSKEQKNVVTSTVGVAARELSQKVLDALDDCLTELEMFHIGVFIGGGNHGPGGKDPSDGKDYGVVWPVSVREKHHFTVAGAVDKEGKRWPESEDSDVWGPGVDVILPNGATDSSTEPQDGTSLVSPALAGIAAVWESTDIPDKFPLRTYLDTRQKLEKGGRQAVLKKLFQKESWTRPPTDPKGPKGLPVAYNMAYGMSFSSDAAKYGGIQAFPAA